MEQARRDIEDFGLRMPPKLRTLVQNWHHRTYARAMDAQREAIVEEFKQTPEGRAALARHKLLDSTG